MRYSLDQTKQPFTEALEAYAKEHFVPFHTPGHKIGVGAPSLLKDWMGPALPYDLGVMYALDDLHEPEGCLKEAQELAADLYGADYTWFSINGTTAAIQTMIMGTVGEGDTVIIPREAHRSVIGGLMLSGAKPVYLEGRFDERWGVPLGTTPDEVRQVLTAHPEAKALVLTYPNYYGIAVHIKAIVDIAHERGVIVLVDEAHGPHLPFGDRLPIEALAAGADVVAQSTHKLTGSLTQTSMLHVKGDRVDVRNITRVHQLLQSTSPNYIFLASLDMARHQLAMEGHQLVTRAEVLAHKLRRQLRHIPGIEVPDLADFEGAYDLDVTKVLIDFRGVGLTGVEAEKRLRQHKIEVELVQGYHVLVLITFGDTDKSITQLTDAVANVAREALAVHAGLSPDDDDFFMEPLSDGEINTSTNDTVNDAARLPVPDVVLTPRQAFMAEKQVISLSEAEGRIAGETISYYPPGIPCVAMGERITKDVIAYFENRQANGYVPNGAADPTLQTITVIREERK